MFQIARSIGIANKITHKLKKYKNKLNKKTIVRQNKRFQLTIKSLNLRWFRRKW